MKAGRVELTGQREVNPRDGVHGLVVQLQIWQELRPQNLPPRQDALGEWTEAQLSGDDQRLVL